MLPGTVLFLKKEDRCPNSLQTIGPDICRSMPVPIVEIIGRSVQGVTKPSICRSADQSLWFVKGKGAGKRSLICEWIAGNLALQFGLPIAPFDLVDIPSALIELGTRDDLHELGSGMAFGSRKLDIVELSLPHLTLIDETIQRDVLMFDWWVRNTDRSLSEPGGNPNLFWEYATEQLIILDHNLAFDPEFSVADLAKSHAFRHQMQSIISDPRLQQSYGDAWYVALQSWESICHSVPAQWWFIDEERTLMVDFDRHAMRQSLMRFQDPAFWRIK